VSLIDSFFPIWVSPGSEVAHVSPEILGADLERRLVLVEVFSKINAILHPRAHGAASRCANHGAARDPSSTS